MGVRKDGITIIQTSKFKLRFSAWSQCSRVLHEPHMGFIPGIPSVSSRKNINISIEVKIRHTSGNRTRTLRYRDGQLMTRKISLAVILVVDEEGDVHDRTHYNVNISIMVKICAIN